MKNVYRTLILSLGIINSGSYVSYAMNEDVISLNASANDIEVLVQESNLEKADSSKFDRFKSKVKEVTNNVKEKTQEKALQAKEVINNIKNKVKENITAENIKNHKNEILICAAALSILIPSICCRKKIIDFIKKSNKKYVAGVTLSTIIGIVGIYLYNKKINNVGEQQQEPLQN